jgi:EpsI family protein
MTQPARAWIRFGLAAALLLGAFAFLQARTLKENIPPRQALSAFPLLLGEWQGREIPIAPEILEVLGAGEFMTRFYWRSAEEPPIDFFVAYFPSQRTGDTIHSPRNCLPGAGWAPLESGRMQVTGPDGRIVTVNRYIIGKGLERQLVLYWYQAHGRVIASEYRAKIYLVLDSLRTNRSDGGLVRVITPIQSSESPDTAEQRAVAFAARILPELANHIPN